MLSVGVLNVPFLNKVRVLFTNNIKTYDKKLCKYSCSMLTFNIMRLYVYGIAISVFNKAVYHT